MSDDTHRTAGAGLSDDFDTDPSLSSLGKVSSLAYGMSTKTHVARWYVAFSFESPISDKTQITESDFLYEKLINLHR